MLSNFKKRVRDHPDATPAQTICARQSSETHVPCTRDSQLLPSSRSIIQVLYPPAYLDIPFPSPEPPPYQGREICPSLSTEGMAPPDPLVEDLSLTGVPSQGIPRRRVPVIEPSPPIIGHRYDLEGETLPAYSRFDQRRPRFPAASDVLGPYPSRSVIRQFTQSTT